MRILSILIFVLSLSNCSFDDKTGIWKNSNEISKKNKNELSDFKKIYTEQKLFSEIIYPKKNTQVSLDNIKENITWNDEFYQGSNNLENFNYEEFNKIVFKSKKLSKYQIGKKSCLMVKTPYLLMKKAIFLFTRLIFERSSLSIIFIKKNLKKKKKTSH